MPAKIRKLKVVSIVSNGHEVIMGKRIDNGLWEFPGGKMELNEGVMEAGLRELEEETGVVPDTYEFTTFFDKPDKIVWVYHGTTDEEPENMEPDKHLYFRYICEDRFNRMMGNSNVTKETLTIHELMENDSYV